MNDDLTPEERDLDLTTCYCSLGEPSRHSHDLPPNRCYCVDREVLKTSDHWVTCPKRKGDR